jgi:hypothetical protein
MDNRRLIGTWHREIISLCREKLGRNLTEAETRFVTSRGGFLALEMITDSVKALDGEELEDYLNQESGSARQ